MIVPSSIEGVSEWAECLFSIASRAVMVFRRERKGCGDLGNKAAALNVSADKFVV